MITDFVLRAKIIFFDDKMMTIVNCEGAVP